MELVSSPRLATFLSLYSASLLAFALLSFRSSHFSSPPPSPRLAFLHLSATGLSPFFPFNDLCFHENFIISSRNSYRGVRSFTSFLRLDVAFKLYCFLTLNHFISPLKCPFFLSVLFVPSSFLFLANSTPDFRSRSTFLSKIYIYTLQTFLYNPVHLCRPGENKFFSEHLCIRTMVSKT